MNILVTGGAGYIGSHTIIELIDQGFNNIFSIDNYLNSSENTYKKVEAISGVKINYSTVDLTNRAELTSFFKNNEMDAVIHFAALKSVPDSVDFPEQYYRNNIISLLNLLATMKEFNVNRLIFSSSCSIYGNPDRLPVNEKTPFGKAESPYASTKQMGETIIKDFCKTQPHFKAVSLRYFNPVGAHPSGLIGEGFTKRPNNLIPIITQVAIGLQEMTVFGTDYNTVDGSCVRDYIYVGDVAKAHVKALQLTEDLKTENYLTINIGTGKGSSVLEIIQSFEKVSGKKLNYKLGERRQGDVAVIYADNKKSKELLDWEAQFSIDEMITTAWQWQQNSNDDTSPLL